MALKMALKTGSGNRTIADRVVFCRTAASQMRGLMFSRSDKGRALIMEFKEEKIVPLHMMFVFFPIDVLFLDRSRKVVEIYGGAKPFLTSIIPKRRAKYVIELPAGAIRSNRIKVGDRLAF
jgi:uncharacterized membrane protein (UPF0127 family)